MAHFYCCCNLCGKFMSFKDMEEGYVYTPYGSCTDMEPPDPLHIHKKCWQNADEETKELVGNITWALHQGVA